jgi:hypothetical protein
MAHPGLLHSVDSQGRRKHVCWEDGAVVRPHGQWVFFAEFLVAVGLCA